MLAKYYELSQLFQDDHHQVDRRLVIVEKVADDLLERLKLSSNIIESYLQSSSFVKKYDQVRQFVDSVG